MRRTERAKEEAAIPRRQELPWRALSKLNTTPFPSFEFESECECESECQSENETEYEYESDPITNTIDMDDTYFGSFLEANRTNFRRRPSLPKEV